MNIRYDDVVHVRYETADGFEPICGEAVIPVELPEPTTDDPTCMWCKSIVE